MILKNPKQVESAKHAGSTRSYSNKDKDIKSNKNLISFTPILDSILGYMCIINKCEYLVSIDKDFNPTYVFSSKENDKYKLNTVSQLHKKINHLELSPFWNYLSTEIEIKGELKNKIMVVDIKSMNIIYTKYHKLYMKEKYKERNL